MVDNRLTLETHLAGMFTAKIGGKINFDLVIVYVRTNGLTFPDPGMEAIFVVLQDWK